MTAFRARTPRTLLVASAAVALGLTVGLAGCSSEPDGALTKENFAEQISQAQQQAGFSHMEMKIGADESTMTTSQVDIAMNEDPTKVAMDMVMSVPQAGDMEVRMVEGTMYVNMGETSDHKFVKLSPEQAAQLGVQDAANQADLDAQLQLMDQAVQQFSAADGGEIDGVDTIKYTLTLDTKRLLGDAAQGLPEGSYEKTYDYDMYVGADDKLTRKLVMHVADSTAEMSFSRWGEQVDVAVPGKDEIVDASQLTAQG